MVFDVPAESGGALSVLDDFYNEVRSHEDININWVFVISKPKLKETANIKVLRFPYIKKSWFHRLYFDTIVAPKLIKEYNVDKIFSLQNVTIPFTNIIQVLYVHQPLPFVNYKFSIRENGLFWIYQNIIGKKIINSMKIADQVIVQTEWMKKASIERSMINKEKVHIVPPIIKIDNQNFFENKEESLSTFFYPASAVTYKNHDLIVQACKQLKKETDINYKVIFTLNGNENKSILKLYKEIDKQQLPIEFRGSMSREQVFELYTKSILIFPSYIETFGLPLLEAKFHMSIIFASDCAFSHEILDGYNNVYFFNPFDANTLSNLMLKSLQGNIKYKNQKENQNQNGKKNIKNQDLIKYII